MTESSFQGQAGTIYTRGWEIDRARGGVVLAHGYGEHLGRYEHVAKALNVAGWSAYGLDHVGHGRSEGERVLIPDFTPVVEDVHTLVGQAKAANPGLPVAMIGHSMGGMIAARYAQLHPGELAALVLSGPVIGTLKGITSLLGMDVIPSDPIDPSVLSRDEEIGRAYSEDPLVWHGPFKRQTLLGIAELLTELAIDADKVTGPVLWLHGGGGPAGSHGRDPARDHPAAQRQRDREDLPGRAARDLQRAQQGRGTGRHDRIPRQGHRRLIGLCQVGVRRDRGRR
jgi:alpha-beta hydrolase superfamily lysophospholipase